MKTPVLLVALVACQAFPAAAAPDRVEVENALRQAVTYFSTKAAFNGGYVYYYSPDFSRRLGEGEARPTEVWVQPPATPSVGGAMLDAYEATGDPYYLNLAAAAGRALLHGQLESGGWRNSIDFDPGGPRADRYRGGRGNGKKGKNFSTLDDGITQSAILFLMRLDEASGQADKSVREAVDFALEQLLLAQFPNGAFPQGWTAPVEARPVLKASFPDYDWRTEGRIKNYWDHYTLNDGVAGSVAEVLILAHRTRGEERFLEALNRLGRFLMDAQLPEPQPGWAQQYGPDMRPIWARAFEPPAVSGRESEDAMLALIRIAEVTGDATYLEPVVSGVKYLQRSLLPDGQLARYYELETNRPLYLQRAGDGYELTHDDSRLPGHYGWKNPHQLELIKAAYRRVDSGGKVDSPERNRPTDELIERIVEELDAEGRWISRHDPDGPRLVGQPKFAPGEIYLSSEVFSANVSALSAYLAR